MEELNYKYGTLGTDQVPFNLNGVNPNFAYNRCARYSWQLSTITKGVGTDQRIGSICRIKALDLRGSICMNSNETSSYGDWKTDLDPIEIIVRMVVWSEKGANNVLGQRRLGSNGVNGTLDGAPPFGTYSKFHAIFETDSIRSFYNRDTMDEVIIHYDNTEIIVPKYKSKKGLVWGNPYAYSYPLTGFTTLPVFSLRATSDTEFKTHNHTTESEEKVIAGIEHRDTYTTTGTIDGFGEIIDTLGVLLTNNSTSSNFQLNELTSKVPDGANFLQSATTYEGSSLAQIYLFDKNTKNFEIRIKFSPLLLQSFNQLDFLKEGALYFGLVIMSHERLNLQVDYRYAFFP